MSAAFRGDEVRHARRRTPPCDLTNENRGTGGSGYYLVVMSDDVRLLLHHLRNELNVISVSAELLAEALPEGDERDDARTIAGAVERATILAANMSGLLRQARVGGRSDREAGSSR